MNHELRLQRLEVELPPAGKSAGVYKLVMVDGELAYVSGHGPVGADGSSICGRLGDTLQKEEGYEAARRTGLRMLASLRQELGSLDAIERLVKTVGFVNATPEFKDHPAVINGFSELMRDVFGSDYGVGVRSAIGVASLPLGWAVEIEAVFKLAAKE
ncbi:MAG TPA: RidA family protein [Lacipirellulaceae bacterium]|nr:RidA family protein [Lacipirellulaceae bacterium]